MYRAHFCRAVLIDSAGGVTVEPPHEIGSGTWIFLFNELSSVTFAMLEKR